MRERESGYGWWWRRRMRKWRRGRGRGRGRGGVFMENEVNHKRDRPLFMIILKRKNGMESWNQSFKNIKERALREVFIVFTVM
jgi:hypothetical protein